MKHKKAKTASDLVTHFQKRCIERIGHLPLHIHLLDGVFAKAVRGLWIRRTDDERLLRTMRGAEPNHLRHVKAAAAGVGAEPAGGLRQVL